ncbi:MAG: helix-turn-helix domain-containing protein [Methylocella sp.]
MTSQKSTSLAAREPQRLRGKLRVAALMRAGAEIFAEKGYDAATMTEIAARGETAIGSLYQFFPNKEALADAVLAHYREIMDTALQGIEERARKLTAAALADALLDLTIEHTMERAAAVALLDRRGDASPQREEFRAMTRQGIARILSARDSQLRADRILGMSAILLQTMKAAAALAAEKDPDLRRSALTELRDMTRFYLTQRLSADAR